MPRIVLDFDPEQPEAPQFSGDTSELVYFLSWAFSARFGASHEMSAAADVLRVELKIDLRPLLTYADREIEEPSDQSLLDNAWQDATPLAESCRLVVDAFTSGDQRLAELQEQYPSLVGCIAELGQIAAWAAEHDSRIRITYLLEES